MRKKLTKMIIFTVVFSLLLGTHYSSLAYTEEIKDTVIIKIADGESGSSTSIITEDFVDNFDPNGDQPSIAEPFTDTIIDVVNALLGALQIIGGILAVISIAMFGLSMIIKSNMPLAHDLGLERMMFFGPGGGRRTRSQKKFA